MFIEMIGKQETGEVEVKESPGTSRAWMAPKWQFMEISRQPEV